MAMEAFANKPNIYTPGKTQLIDEGGYGCVFYPGINCNGKKENRKFITKIQKVNDTFKNEYNISQKVRKIRGYAKHFGPIIKVCPVKLTKTTIHEIQKCDKVASESKSTIESPLYVSSKIRYVGKLNIGQYIQSCILRRHSIAEVLDTHVYLLKGLAKLNANGIIHFDIKYDNIIYDETLRAPIIIDFGLSVYKPDLSPSTYSKDFYIFMTYTYWCIDILICNYIFNKVQYENSKTEKVTEHELGVIYQMFISGINHGEAHNNSLFYLKLLSSTSYDTLNTKYTAYFNAFIGKTWFELYEHLIAYSNTWDNYSLSMLYLLEMDELYRTHPTIYNKIMKFASGTTYMTILETIVCSMPNERPTLEDTRHQIKRLL
jgi:serine/threonine protein kinase